MGAGMGGNLQFTIGTSANFVWGRQFDIRFGPDKVDVDPAKYSTPVGAKIMCGLLAATTLAWFIFYATQQSDHDRATWTIAYQSVFDIMMTVLMEIEMLYNQTGMGFLEALKYLFKPELKDPLLGWGSAELLAHIASAGLILGVPVATLVTDAVKEGDSAK
jgi:hypothetical protein